MRESNKKAETRDPKRGDPTPKRGKTAVVTQRMKRRTGHNRSQPREDGTDGPGRTSPGSSWNSPTGCPTRGGCSGLTPVRLRGSTLERFIANKEVRGRPVTPGKTKGYAE